MAIVQNTAGQGLYVYAYDNTTDLAKTGDSANITATISKDGGGLLAGEGWPAACRRVGHNGCYGTDGLNHGLRGLPDFTDWPDPDFPSELRR